MKRDYSYFNSPESCRTYVQKAYNDGYREGKIKEERSAILCLLAGVVIGLLLAGIIYKLVI